MTAAIASISARVHTAPVGLFGLFSTSHLVFGVIAASISSGRGRKPLFCGQVTNTGVPSHSWVICA